MGRVINNNEIYSFKQFPQGFNSAFLFDFYFCCLGFHSLSFLFSLPFVSETVIVSATIWEAAGIEKSLTHTHTPCHLLNVVTY